MSAIDPVEQMEQSPTESADGPAVTADPVATVNGTQISNADFAAQQSRAFSGQGIDPASLDSETQASVQNEVLDSLISQELLRQAAAAEVGGGADDAAIDAQLEVIKNQFPDEAMFEQALDAEGLTETELRTQLSADLGVESYLEETLDLASITVTEEEVAEVYQEAAAQQELPPLEQVRTEVEQLAIQQKQQPLIAQHIAELRASADIEIFI